MQTLGTHVFFAHGLAVKLEDLPLPLSTFYLSAIFVLVVSFALLTLGTHKFLTKHVIPRRTNLLPSYTSASIFAINPICRAWRMIACSLGVIWLIIVLTNSLFGNADAADNPAPALIFVAGWLGAAVLSVLIGKSALFLHPPLALAKAMGMREEVPSNNKHAHKNLDPGFWPAFVGIFIFVWLELVFPTGAHVRLLGSLVMLWTFFVAVASSKYGLSVVRDKLDPFAAYMTLLSSLSIIGHSTSGKINLRFPFLSPNYDIRPARGLSAFVTLLIGSVSYDGLTRTTWWQRRVSLATADLVQNGIDPTFSRLAFGTFGLLCMVLIAWGSFEAASYLAQKLGKFDISRTPTRTATLFAPTLIPIAFGYAIAHYFSFFVVQGQDIFSHIFWVPSGRTVWIVQVVAIVTAHVVGLMLAHDRALELQRNTKLVTLSQIPMLLLMLFYTIGGLYFLSEGLA